MGGGTGPEVRASSDFQQTLTSEMRAVVREGAFKVSPSNITTTLSL